VKLAAGLGEPMVGWTWKSAWAVGLMGLFLAGCQHAGPTSIEWGRPNYNDAIQRTSGEQLLANLVRVRQQEMPLVMDVTQVNAGLVLQGSVNSSISGIGGQSALASAGKTVTFANNSGALAAKVISTLAGAAGSTFQYQENPTITYTPLSGQPLIAQLTTPISVDSLAQMPDSGWPVPSLFTLAVNYMTLDYNDIYYASDAIFQLDDDNVLNLSWGKSPLSGQTANDALYLHIVPHLSEVDKDDPATNEESLRLWLRLLKLYWRVQPKPQDQGALAGDHADFELLDALSEQLSKYDSAGQADAKLQFPSPAGDGPSLDMNAFVAKAFTRLPDSIEVRTSPIDAKQTAGCRAGDGDAVRCLSSAPVMRTRSALGMLRQAVTEPGPLVAFVTPDQYRCLRALPWNTSTVDEGRVRPFYSVTPDQRCGEDRATTDIVAPDQLEATTQAFVKCYLDHYEGTSAFYIIERNAGVDRSCSGPSFSITHNGASQWLGGPDALSTELAENALAILRRYVLIVRSREPPGAALPAGETPFVSYFNDGYWYTISNADPVSKQNFALMSELMSIMALPNAGSAPPAPTISVGGGR
jgi:hypothetical protein